MSVRTDVISIAQLPVRMALPPFVDSMNAPAQLTPPVFQNWLAATCERLEVFGSSGGFNSLLTNALLFV